MEVTAPKRMAVRRDGTGSLLLHASLLAGLCLLGSSAGGAQSASSQAANAAVPVRANLNITPKRLTFSRGTRSGTVYVYNQGQVPAAVDIQVVDRIMLPNGEIIAAADAAERPELAPILARVKSAKPMVIATPRRAVLAPGRGQTIRLRVVAPAAEQSAEYRSHLTVTTMPPREVGLSAEEASAAEQSGRFAFNVTSLFGLSIPIIIRAGNASPQGNIANVQLQRPTAPGSPQTHSLNFDLTRLGQSSIYGNIEVRSKRERALIAFIRGVGVYPEIDTRRFTLPLQRNLAKGEQVEISFIDDDLNPGRVLMRSDFVAP